jgi:hypothetical protein
VATMIWVYSIKKTRIRHRCNGTQDKIAQNEHLGKIHTKQVEKFEIGPF